MARTQLNFRLREEQKERWEEHAEQSRFDDHMSDLVKRAVENQIERDQGDFEGGKMEPPENHATGEVLDRIQTLQNALVDLQSDVNRAVDALHEREGVDPEVGPELYSILPVGEENAKRTEEIYEALGSMATNETAVSFALENLNQNMETVVKLERGGRGLARDYLWYKTE